MPKEHSADLVTHKNPKRRAMEANRAAADRLKEIKQRAGGWIGHTLRRPEGPLSGTRRGNVREGDPDSPGGAQECQS